MKKSLFIFALMLATVASAFAQNIMMQGNVISKTDGEPIIGASVYVTDNQTIGTMTDFDGNFTLEVPATSTVTVSYIGFQTQVVKAQANVNIILEEDSQMLEEMVVLGYQTQRKVDLTGAVSAVDTKNLKTASSPDPMSSLQGRIAGVTITPSNGADPNGTGVVRIRGIGSFNADQNPLYVIDGVPTTQTLNSLNANDIESMQVLKDAASASIYGSRAANGVIIITTKKGKAGEQKVKVDFSASLTAQFYTAQSQMKLMNSQQYATAMAQAALNDGIDPVTYAKNFGLDLNAAQGTHISAWDPASNSYKEYTVNGAYDGYINTKRTMRYSDTDWLDAISRTGLIQNYDLSLSHATEKSNSMFSLGYKNNAGIIRYTNFDNISARMNSSYKVNKAVTVGENFTLTHTQYVSSSPMENALKMSPTVPLYEEDGKTFSGPVGGMSDRQNPLREIYQNRDNNTEIWRVFGNAYVDITPIKGLLIRSNFGIDYDAAFHHYYTYTFHSDIVNNDIAKVSTGQANDMKWNWSNTAQYNIDLGAEKNHHVTALGGFELYSQTRHNIDGYAEGFDIEDKNYMWLDSATGTEHAYGGKSGYKLVSFFGKADYNWNDLLLASFTIRYDGSSRFGKNNRYGTFPAASLGYRLAKHLNQDWIDDLKVRASWGVTGNQAISNYARYTLFSADYGDTRETGTAYDLYLQGSGQLPSGYRPYQSANNNIKWETATQYNIGVDYNLFNQSIYGSYEFFVKNVEDMLINPGYLGSRGEGGAAWENGPDLRNWGMELSLGYRTTLDNGLGIDVNANVDFFRNRVTYLPEKTTGSYVHTATENLVESKRPYGSIVGYVFDGLFQSKEEVLASGQENARVGGLKYADLDGNGIINEYDQTWIFTPVPDFSYGLNVALNWKGFDFAMFWQGVAGQDIYNDQKFQTDFWSLTDAGSNKGNNMLKAWTTDNKNSKIPALTTNNTANENRCSSYFVENGSYVKLRNLQFGWTVPNKWLSKAMISNARVYVSGQNLLTIKSKSLTCPDPENPRWMYPNATSMTLGIQIGF